MAKDEGFLERVRGNAEWDALKWLWAIGRSTLISSLYVVFERVRHLHIDWIGAAILFVLLLILLLLIPKRGREAEADPLTAPGMTTAVAFKQLSVEQQTLVYRKFFSNEVVVVDGKNFSYCTFQNVKFKYDGTATFSISNCTARGFGLSSDSDAVTAAWIFVKALGLMKIDLIDEHGEKFPNISEPKNSEERPK